MEKYQAAEKTLIKVASAMSASKRVPKAGLGGRVAAVPSLAAKGTKGLTVWTGSAAGSQCARTCTRDDHGSANAAADATHGSRSQIAIKLIKAWKK